MASADVQISDKPRGWLRVSVTLALAVALGLALQQLLRARLDAIQSLASHDLIRARAELAGILRVVAVGVFGMTGTVGIAFSRAGGRAMLEERFPPSGVWSWRAVRVVSGPRARAMGRVAIGLGIAVFLLSVCGAAVSWYIASVLLACRAT